MSLDKKFIVGIMILYLCMIPVDAVIYNNPSLPGLRAIDSSNYNLIKAINYTLVHVNASDFWDELNTPADITYDDISGGNVEAAGYSGYFSFLVGTVGALDMNGDPWYFTGSDYEFGNNTKFDKNISIDGYVNVGKDINPVTTLLSNIGSGAKRWLQLFVQNISAEHIDTYSLTATDNVNIASLNVTTSANFHSNVTIDHKLTVKSINVTNNIYSSGNLIITGNMSVKRPYFNGYDNSTQGFLNTANTQVINISNNLDFDSYQIHIINNQNLTFDNTGDYVCILSPEFYQVSGTNKIITFWIEKNGIDVAWSNSRYTIINGQYFAPSITYQFDIENPLTDNIRFEWYSDSTNTQIISISGLTLPTRPSIPGILLNCQKVSEITE